MLNKEEEKEVVLLDAIENHCKVEALLNGKKKVELEIDPEKYPPQAEQGIIGMKVGDLYKPSATLTYEIKKIYPPVEPKPKAKPEKQYEYDLENPEIEEDEEEPFEEENN